MSKVPIQLWSSNRNIKKCFMCTPRLNDVIEKGKVYKIISVCKIFELKFIFSP